MMVYFIRNPNNGLIKIGYSIEPWNRLITLQIAWAAPLELLGVIEGRHKDEKTIHQRFKEIRVGATNPRSNMTETEWFEPSDNLLGFIRENAVPPLDFIIKKAGLDPKKDVSKTITNIMSDLLYKATQPKRNNPIRDPQNVSPGAKLRRLVDRKCHGRDDKEIASAAGMHPTAFSRLLNGKIADPHMSTLNSVLNAIGATLSDFDLA